MAAEYGGSSINKGSSSSTSGGFLFGVVLFLAAFPLLFWNEGNAVQTARALEEGKGAVISLQVPVIDPANEGKLVHFVGSAVTSEELVDDYTGVRAHAIKLHRGSRMYQWKETARKKENTTEYYYDKVWSEFHMNSSNYHNQQYSNPPTMKITSQMYVAQNVTVGDYRLSPKMIADISEANPYPLDQEKFSTFPDSLRSVAIPHEGGFYLGSSPQDPQIGDIQVQYKVYPEQEVSVVGKQENRRAVVYTTSNGKTIELIYPGFKTADEIFEAEQTKNVIITWVIRGAGVMVMYIGLMLSVGQVARIFSWIPFLGSAVASGVSMIAGLLSLSLSFVVISVAWIFYRPLLGIGLLVVAGVLVGLIIRKAKSGQREEPSGDMPPPIPPPIP